MVRRKKVQDALDILQFIPKRAATPMANVIKSAAQNAKNNFKQDLSDLYIHEIHVTSGSTLKRRLPVSRGRAHPILKRTSHIKILLEAKKKKKKTIKKNETKRSPSLKSPQT